MGGRAFAIVNPAAGAGRSGRRWPRLAARLARAGLAVDTGLTRGVGDATRLARHAVALGHTLVVAVGGDGTVNEIVNGIVGDDGVPRAALGIIPTGRGRDVCRNLGIPRDPVAAIDAIASGIETRADLGLIRGSARARFFVGAVGVGFDADVARRAHRLRAPGTMPYLLGALGALAHHRSCEVRITGDMCWAGAATAIVAANGPFYGGGMKIAPAADVADGRLDLVILGRLGRAELLWRLPTVYRGSHVRHRSVVMSTVRTVSIRSDEALPVHVDGELAGTTPVDVTLCAGALRVRRPGGL